MDGPQLSKIAVSILCLIPTSAAVERSFRRHAWNHSARRNRLTTDRAAEFVFIAHNFALCDNNVLDRGRTTGETDSTVMVATARPTVGTKINMSEDRDVDIESEASKVMSLRDSSDEMENFNPEGEV